MVDAGDALGPDVAGQLFRIDFAYELKEVRPAEDVAEVDAHADTKGQGGGYVCDAYCRAGLPGDGGRDADCVEV